MIAKAVEVQADAIGMSGLLVKSTLIMRENLEELNAVGLSHIPVLLGGAALTRSYVERDLREVYDGRVFYGRDAFEGLHTMDRLMEMKRTNTDDPEFGRLPTGRVLPDRSATRPAASLSSCRRSPFGTTSRRRTTVPRGRASRVVARRHRAEVNETALPQPIAVPFRPRRDRRASEPRRPLLRQQSRAA